MQPKPKISDETMKRMAEFFLNTSVPRIIVEERKTNETNTTNNT